MVNSRLKGNSHTGLAAMNNASFRRALLSLSHPISILGIIVVLLNDHWWRRTAPSWFTGKIGDFAWLIFAPFLLAALLAWLFPWREKFVGYVSIIGVGLIFGLAKTVPAFHALTIDVLEFLTGWPNVLKLDPTDLLSLPALLIAWWIWERLTNRSFRLADRGWVLLPLAVFATMADSAMPSYGINCLEQKNDLILAVDTHVTYASRDGGLTWTDSDLEPKTRYCGLQVSEVSNPVDQRERFRFSEGGTVERSPDGGQTWQAEYLLQDATEAQQVYIGQNQRGNPSLASGALDALIDPKTGNLIVGVGYQGVLVRTPAGSWQAIGVGEYRPVDLQRPETIVSLLAGEILAALVVFALAVGTIAWGKLLRRPRLGLLLGWLAFGGGMVVRVMFLSPGGYSQTGSQFFAYGTLIAGVIGVIVAATCLMAMFKRNPAAGWATVGMSALAALLFLVPFLVWSQDGIPSYVAALAFALVLVGVTCLAGYHYLRRYDIKPDTLQKS
jgi:hypothetical protein